MLLRTLNITVAALAIIATAASAQDSAIPAQTKPERAFPMAPSAPRGAPNILIIMTDDEGFGASSSFGGPVPMPTSDALAATGLRYNRFHTTAMCSPTRAALLTGRNHHAVGMGAITNVATPDPGYTSVIPDSAATIGNILRASGYATAWIGKNHNTPEWEITPAGPFNRWPSGYGFDYFYGFIGGATSQFAPALVEGHRPRTPPTNDPSYILDRDLADHAIEWVTAQKSVRPDQPFLMYLAPGSPHSPHQAPADWIARFKGRFDKGWDAMREETLKRQIAMGVVPKGTALTKRPEAIPAWSSLSPQEQRVAARMMEIYAAQLSYFDNQLGRLVAELKRTGEFDNTLIFYVHGDNGASAEGGISGSISDLAGLNGIRPGLSEMASGVDLLGGPLSYGNYPTGWAWAMNTPFQWMKQIASHLGGTRNGLIVNWPERIKKGEIRSQFHHVIDIAPTIYEAAGITPPQTFNGVKQQPIEGVSMLYSFRNAKAPDARREQYFELLGNRAYYKDGWIAVTTPGRPPWNISGGPKAEDFNWELYNLDKDFSQAHDLSAKEPHRIADLQAAFRSVAERENVYPLDADFGHRIDSSLRPYVFNGRTDARFANSSMRYPDTAFPDIKNRSWVLEADFTVANGTDSGTIITQGGWVAGWGLFLIEGKPVFLYKQADGISEAVRIASTQALAPGAHKLEVRFDYDGGGRGKGGAVEILVDGARVAQGRLDRTVPSLFVGEGASIGRDYGTPLTADYQLPFIYPGDIREVRFHFPQSPTPQQPAN
ncbi:arylsulfatase [Sphingobium sp. B11D3D]|uniref:arylsulfatase n=1 Tax=Sphingobium sp. B11D3D TaxID=2940576 RepID=UPI00222526F3|nr:arylsulfatase [Sphingobium sp. B11D3D]MCW2370778.1 arylsulfatase [Sphingobium sp. B11D3D]